MVEKLVTSLPDLLGTSTSKKQYTELLFIYLSIYLLLV